VSLKQHIAAAEAKLRRASLAAALGDDAGSLGKPASSFRRCVTGRELLNLALVEAERMEAERKSRAARAGSGRPASVRWRKKTGQLERDAAEIGRLTEALHNARNRMTDTSQGIVALLPPSLRTDARPLPGDARNAGPFANLLT